MIEEAALELHAVIKRLRADTVQLGLLDSEVARILGRTEGGWPMPVAEQWSRMDPAGEKRIRLLGAVCRLALARFGAHAPLWLRSFNAEAGTAPLAYLLDDAGGLRALVRALSGQVRAHP